MVLNPPVIKIYEWNTREISSPIGQRHIAGGSFAFKQVVGSGCILYNPLFPNSSSGTLLFNGTTFDITNGQPPSHLASTPLAITIHLSTSGVGISNLKFYLTEDTALKASHNVGLDNAFIQYTVSGIWQPNCLMPSGTGGRLTKSVPTLANIKRQDGGFGLVGEDDFNSSQFIYMNIIIPWGTPIGTYGVCGSGNLRFALSYDYFFDDYP